MLNLGLKEVEAICYIVPVKLVSGSAAQVNSISSQAHCGMSAQISSVGNTVTA